MLVYTDTITFKLAKQQENVDELRDMATYLTRLPGAQDVEINWTPKAFRLHVEVILKGSLAFVNKGTSMIRDSITY